MPRGRPAPPPAPDLGELMPGDQTPGRNVSVADYIIEQLNAGVDLYNAAATAGILPDQLQAWLREGTLGFARLNRGADWTKDFTPVEQDVIVFAVAAQRANARHIATLAVTAEQLARGGRTRTRHRRKLDTAGAVVESEEWTETLLPDPDMLRWKLERLAPEVYGQRAALNVTVVDLTDTPDVAAEVAAQFDAIRVQLAPPALPEGAPDDQG